MIVDAELYLKNNFLQKHEARRFLDLCSGRLTWRTPGERLIDLGCGDGSVTTEVLQTYMPTDYEALVGVDINSEMIDHAQKFHSTDRIQFYVGDIEGNFPEYWLSSFDHVISLFALHWGKDQQKVFKNIIDLLKPSGECCASIVGRAAFFTMYRYMSKHTRWSSMIPDVEFAISPYQDSEDPVKDLTVIMSIVGFQDADVSVNEHVFTYNDLNSFKKSSEAICPYKIPKGREEEYYKDYFEIATNNKVLDVVYDDANEIQSVTMKHNFIHVLGRKPS